ncbi:MAG: flavodoxin family protein [Oscillospiraceae bacterium]|nr:flavodoxin family protein [Oscillospiraceae bacterium]
MKILVLNGSPRLEQSSTLRLTLAFLEGYSSVIDSEIEFLPVHRLDFNPCLGCLTCWKRTPGRCVHRDDATEWIEKVVHADMVVWSFPLFYSGMPGKLKMFLDRQCCTLRPNFLSREDYPEAGLHGDRVDRSGQQVLVFGTCGHFNGNANFSALRCTLDYAFGEGRYTPFFFGEGEMMQLPWLKEQTEALVDVVKAAGVEFGRTGAVSAETRAKMEVPLIPDRETFETQARSYYAHCEDKAARRAAEAAQS